MLYIAPSGSTDPNAPYVGKNVAAGTQGSKVPPAAVENPQRELVAVITAGQAAGLGAPTNADRSQVLKAVRSGLLGRFVASGTPDAITIAPDPVCSALVEGMRFRAKLPGSGANTTTTPTLGVNSLTAQIRRRDGTPPVAGDLVAGRVVEFEIDGDLRARIVGLAASDLPAAPTLPPVSQWHVGTAGGTTSAVTVSDLTPAITAYADKLPIFLVFPGGVADGASVNVAKADGTPLGAIPIQRNDGSPIQRADIPPGGPALFNLYGTGALRLASFGRAEVQRIVTNATLYVRTDGNDGNDGSANDAGHAFATIAAALASAARFSNTSTVVIQLGNAGTFAAPNNLPKTGAAFKIMGDGGNPSAYVIAGAGALNDPPISVGGASLELNGVTIQNTGTSRNTIGASLGGSITTKNTILTAVPGFAAYHAAAFAAGSIVISGGTVFAASAGGMVVANGGSVVLDGALSVTNGPTWATGGVAAVSNGAVTVISGTSFGGSASGPRYYLTTNGTINTNGGGGNFFPGSTILAPQSGGQYV